MRVKSEIACLRCNDGFVRLSSSKPEDPDIDPGKATLPISELTCNGEDGEHTPSRPYMQFLIQRVRHYLRKHCLLMTILG